MKVIDTNLLLRLATNDDPVQCQQAAALLQSCLLNEVFICNAVLVEFFFILESKQHPYKLSRKEVVATLAGMLKLPQLYVNDKTESAIQLAASQPKLDFTDCLLAVYADMSANGVLTFDKDLLKFLR